MPCGNKPLVKKWDKPKSLRVIKPSPHEKNDPSVKQHWRNVVHELELSYKDDKFWESQRNTVRELVGPVVFERIIKIFNLPHDHNVYTIPDDASIEASEKYFVEHKAQPAPPSEYSMKEGGDLEEDESDVEEEELQNEDDWSAESHPDIHSPRQSSQQKHSQKTLTDKTSRAASILTSRNFSRMIYSKSFSHRVVSTMSIKSKTKSKFSMSDSLAQSADDLDVHLATIYGLKRRYDKNNPHFDMLYCNESETDMIKWDSKYKPKVFEVSASDEFSKKAEIMTKQIAKDFYDWWTNFGSSEYKTDIKRPEDIEALFQVWFDEHASRSLVLDPKILPCVLDSIAKYLNVPNASCSKVLKKQIQYDVKAETSPAHTTAFNTPLPQDLKHIPPRNNTDAFWHSVRIPEDLRSMAAVFDDIKHLTATKAFQKWLRDRPHLSMPPILDDRGDSADKKALFVIPSDYITRDKSSETSGEKSLDPTFPVSEYTMELKNVLSNLMNY